MTGNCWLMLMATRALRQIVGTDAAKLSYGDECKALEALAATVADYWNSVRV